jgi:tetratricopeptide (TPR) repeat protein
MGTETSEVSNTDTLNKYDETLSYADKMSLNNKAGSYTVIPTNEVKMACEDVLKRDPKNAKALFTLVQYFYAKDKRDMSKRYLDRLLELHPDWGDAQEFLAHKFPEDADGATMDAVVQDPEKLFRLASHFMSQDKYDDAKPLLEGLVLANSTHLDARKCLTEIYMSEGQYKEALTQLTILRTYDPEDPFLEYNVGIACMQSGDTSRARGSFEAAKKKSHDPDFIEEIDGLLGKLD